MSEDQEMRQRRKCTGMLRSCALWVVVKPNPAITVQPFPSQNHKIISENEYVLVGSQNEYPAVAISSNNLFRGNQRTIQLHQTYSSRL